MSASHEPPRPSAPDPRPFPIRVVLPFHLRTLARVDDEVKVAVSGPVSIGAVLDALEGEFPVLRGTIRDHGTRKRRAFLRFFACGNDLSNEPPETLLPEEILSGSEPLFIIGAIAGG
jgi:molybdopterin synthase sulfur carrier subunit